jgi:Putative transposase
MASGIPTSSPIVRDRCSFRAVLEKLTAAHKADALQFFGKHAALTNPQAFAAYLARLRNREWVVYSKRPFGGPAEVLRYLARYTHRVAIPNSRLVALNEKGRHFQMEGLPPRRSGAIRRDDARHPRVHPPLPNACVARAFHRIRYYGLLASSTHANNIARVARASRRG